MKTRIQKGFDPIYSCFLNKFLFLKKEQQQTNVQMEECWSFFGHFILECMEDRLFAFFFKLVEIKGNYTH